MIENLWYVVNTRPNITLVVGMVARFSENSKENHMMVVKIIMRYLKGTKEYGLWYKIGGNLDLKVFIDVDWVGIIDNRKSTTGGAFFLDKRLVPWTRKKENCISQSTTKVEYVVVIIYCSNYCLIQTNFGKCEDRDQGSNSYIL